MKVDTLKDLQSHIGKRYWVINEQHKTIELVTINSVEVHLFDKKTINNIQISFIVNGRQYQYNATDVFDTIEEASDTLLKRMGLMGGLICTYTI